MRSTYQPQPSTIEILQIMKKHPYSQILQGQEITYSILSKKQQTFLFGNDRFLLLKGIQSISYARELPPHAHLPFKHPAELPHPKSVFLLSEIEHYSSNQELLTIQFSGDKKVKWEFVCPSNQCAQQWNIKLNQATKALSEFASSGYSSYEEFLKSKEAASQLRYNQQVNQVNSLLGFNDGASVRSDSNSRARNLSSGSGKTQNYASIQPNFTAINHQNTIITGSSTNQADPHLLPVTNLEGLKEAQQPIEHSKQLRSDNQQLNYAPSSIFTNQKTKTNSQIHQDSPINSFKEVEKPTTVLFQGSKIATLSSIPSQSKLQMEKLSVSHLSYSQRLKVKQQAGKLRRNWVYELLTGEQMVSLVIDFKNYIQRVAEIIINELSLPKDTPKVYPISFESKEHSEYLLQDVSIEIYHISQDYLIQKNTKYKAASIEFKNFDYLLGVTKNQGLLKVPLMMMFQFKGFQGMARSRIQSNGQYANRELYQSIDKKQFEGETRISAESLLDQNNCQIVRLNGIINNGNKAYFIQRLAQFLPHELVNKKSLLRPEFMQDEELDQIVFRNPAQEISQQWLVGAVQHKINCIVSYFQEQKDYFTNSKELAEIIHSYGLNIRHLGLICERTKQLWLKRLIREDITARCLKNYFRFDLQNLAKAQQREPSKDRQEERERNRVTSFLNIIFGNSQTTYRIWRNLNSYAQEVFHLKLWDHDFSDINPSYLLQAVQHALKISLANNISDKKPFKHMNTFDPKDFLQFEFDTTIYNLDFTDIFEEIHECLDKPTFESFHNLCQVLTEESPSKLTYFQVLKHHPIIFSIREFLLQFTSPQENQELYYRIEETILPSRLLYESKLAQIKWHLKSGKHEEANKPIAFIQNHLKKWVGDVHPLFTTLNRLLAEYFIDQPLFYGSAIKYAQDSLEMQRQLFGGDCQQIWKDHFLVAKIHFLNSRPQQAVGFLVKAKSLVNVEKLSDFQVYGDLCLMLAKGYIAIRYFKEAYSTSKQLYKLIRNQSDERSLAYIIEAVAMIKQLLDINQQHESFQRFLETDFSEIVMNFTEYPLLMMNSIKLIAIPSLKTTLLKNFQIRGRLLSIVESISKITQTPNSSIAFLRAKVLEGSFPRNYHSALKDIDAIIQEIDQNQMLQRWYSFNKMANEAILDKISGNINRVFEFMAFLTAIFNLLGPEVLGDLLIMEK